MDWMVSLMQLTAMPGIVNVFSQHLVAQKQGENFVFFFKVLSEWLRRFVSAACLAFLFKSCTARSTASIISCAR